MKLVETILSIIIKILMIIWGTISLFLLFIASILIYFIFKLKFKLFKYKVKNFTNDFSLNNIFFKNSSKPSKSLLKTNSYSSSHNESIKNIKTVKRILETKDGEIT